ncbi:PhoH-like phosphate starvation-inducible [Vibrio phage D472]
MGKRHNKEDRPEASTHSEVPMLQPTLHKVSTTKNHTLYNHALYSKNMAPILCIGSAGTGKTFGAIKAAVTQLEEKSIRRIVVIRPQETFAAKAGYLPGTEREKLEPWIRPVHECLLKLGFTVSQIEHMEKCGVLAYYDLGMIQGLTFDNAFILVDECQNMSYEQLRGLLTREGQWSRTTLCGDVAQTSPMFKNSGLPKFLDMVEAMNADCHVINMTRDDVVRSSRCKQWIMDFEDYDTGMRLNEYKSADVDDPEEELPIYMR